MDQMERFEESTAGRLLMLAISVPLVAGASVAWDDGRAGSTIIMGSVVICITLAIFAGGAAAERPVKHSVAALLALPPTLLAYFPLLSIASHSAAVRVGLAAAAVGFVALVLKGTFARTQARPVKALVFVAPVGAARSPLPSGEFRVSP